jgi:hypothetical protein
MGLRSLSHGHCVFVFLLAAVGLVAGAGCGDPSGVGKTIPVAGKVTVGGQALTTGSVSFRPDSTKGNQSTFEPAGMIEGDGSYQLKTNGKPGAPPGWYKVIVVAEDEADSTNPTPKSKVNPRYKDLEKTLSVEVKEGAAPDAYDLKLTK